MGGSKDSQRKVKKSRYKFNPSVGTTKCGYQVVIFPDVDKRDVRVEASSAILGDDQQAWDNPGSSGLLIGLQDLRAVVRNNVAENVGLKPQTADGSGWRTYPIPDEVLVHLKAHLSREQVKGLMIVLEYWLATGKLWRE